MDGMQCLSEVGDNPLTFNPSIQRNTTMATTPATVAGAYGIDLTLTNYTIESYNETETPQRELVPDQKNAVANEIKYDTRWELRLTVRGSSKPSATTITFNSSTWVVDSVE